MNRIDGHLLLQRRPFSVGLRGKPGWRIRALTASNLRLPAIARRTLSAKTTIMITGLRTFQLYAPFCGQPNYVSSVPWSPNPQYYNQPTKRLHLLNRSTQGGAGLQACNLRVSSQKYLLQRLKPSSKNSSNAALKRCSALCLRVAGTREFVQSVV